MSVFWKLFGKWLSATLAVLSVPAQLGYAQNLSIGGQSTTIIYDSSNSMWGQINGVAKYEIASQVVSDLMTDWPDEEPIGLLSYGHRQRSSCEDIELLVPPRSGAQQAIVESVRAIRPNGKTPLGRSLEQAIRSTSSRETLILLSDGVESCAADPCSIAAQYEARDPGLTIHVVGFGLGSDQDSSQLSCIARNTGGLYQEANSTGELYSVALEIYEATIGSAERQAAMRAALLVSLRTLASEVTDSLESENISLARAKFGEFQNLNPSEFKELDGLEQSLATAISVLQQKLDFERENEELEQFFRSSLVDSEFDRAYELIVQLGQRGVNTAGLYERFKMSLMVATEENIADGDFANAEVRIALIEQHDADAAIRLREALNAERELAAYQALILETIIRAQAYAAIGEGLNSFLSYQDVLSIDPKNPTAIDGSQVYLESISATVSSALEAGDLEAAEDVLIPLDEPSHRARFDQLDAWLLDLDRLILRRDALEEVASIGEAVAGAFDDKDFASVLQLYVRLGDLPVRLDEALVLQADIERTTRLSFEAAISLGDIAQASEALALYEAIGGERSEALRDSFAVLKAQVALEEDIASLLDQAEAAQGQADLAGAVALYEEVLTLDPERSEALAAVGTVRDEAFMAAETAISLGDVVEASEALALYEAIGGERSEALQDSFEVLQTQVALEEDIASLLDQAETAQGQADLAGAVALYEEVLRLDPERSEALAAVDTVRDEAFMAAETAISLGDIAEASEALALYEAIGGERSEALRDSFAVLKAQVALEEDIASLLEQAEAAQGQADLAGAVALYEEVLALDPERFEALAAVGTVRDEAFMAAETAISLGDVVEASEALALYEAIGGERSEALRDSFAVLKAQVALEEDIASLLDQAEAAQGQADLAGAVALYEEVLTLDPERSEALAAVDTVRDEAFMAAETAISLGDVVEASEALALYEAIGGERSEALQDSFAVLQAQVALEEDIASLLEQAEAAQGQADLASAVALYEEVLTLDPERSEALAAVDTVRDEAFMAAETAISLGDVAQASEALALYEAIGGESSETLQGSFEALQTQVALEEDIASLLEEAEAAQGQADLAGAVALYEEVLTLDPARSEALAAVGTVRDEAFMAAETAISLGDIAQATEALALYEAIGGESSEALQGSFEALQTQVALEEDIASLLEEAEAAQGQADLAGAVALYQEVLALDPERSEALAAVDTVRDEAFMAAETAISLGDVTEASEALALYETIGGQSGQELQRLLDELQEPPDVVPSHLETGSVFQDFSDAPPMVVIPAGEFTMGSPTEEPLRHNREGPQQRIEFDQPFAMSQHEVTFAQWDACVADGGCTYQDVDMSEVAATHPVTNVSWEDAQDYVDWINRRVGGGYGLPSEAQWEYAARAGTTTPFHTGEQITTEQANFNGQRTYNGSPTGQNRGKTVEVGSFAPNAFGLYDMHGNVWEWAQDCWSDDLRNHASDGRGDTRSTCARRALRGGAWIDGPDLLRSASRIPSRTTITNFDIGFRLVKALDLPAGEKPALDPYKSLPGWREWTQDNRDDYKGVLQFPETNTVVWERTEARGNGGGVGMRLDRVLEIQPGTRLSFEVLADYRDVARGCGFACREYPVALDMVLQVADGSQRRVKFAWNYGDAFETKVFEVKNQAYAEVYQYAFGIPQSQWHSVTLDLDAYVSDTNKILSMRVFGNGWNFRGGVRGLQFQEGANATSLAPGDVFQDFAGAPEMVVIPAGSFLMGSPWSEPRRDDDEGPQQRITIGEAFAMSRYEVTFGQWDACVDAGGCRHRPDDRGWGRGDRPVIKVSWEDAQEYVRWLNGRTGGGYSLPSEAQWEYAARAGTTTPFYTGERITTAQANFDGDATYNGSSKGTYREQTVSVGSFAPNGFGLYDMHGNVWEWTQDCWVGNLAGHSSDGRANLDGDCDRRVLRGGSWYGRPRTPPLRLSHQELLHATDRHSYGFRLLKTL